MLNLIEQSIQTRNAFYEQFTGKRSKRKAIDVNQTKRLLAELYREKVRLQRHLWKERVRYKGELPLKRKRTIQYYQKVIEKCAVDLEAILRRV
jgi:hypothetical protein